MIDAPYPTGITALESLLTRSSSPDTAPEELEGITGQVIDVMRHLYKDAKLEKNDLKDYLITIRNSTSIDPRITQAIENILNDELPLSEAPTTSVSFWGFLDSTKRTLEHRFYNSLTGWKVKKYKFMMNAMFQGIDIQDRLPSTPLGYEIQKLFEIYKKNSSNPSEHQKVLLDKYREILNSPQFALELKLNRQSQEVQTLLKIGNNRFTQFKAFTFIESLFLLIKEEGEKNISPKERKESPFAYNARCLDNASPKSTTFLLKSIMAKGRAYTGYFDDHREGNYPFPLYALTVNSNRVDLIRTPSIAADTDIVPEVKAFLYSLDESEVYLYANLQARETYFEGQRTEKILNLASKHKNFVVLSFDQDTNWYHQEGPFQDHDNTISFLNAFKERLLSHDSMNYFFPKEWIEQTTFNNDIGIILDFIHSAIFKSLPTLTQNDRKDFIELATNFIILYAIKKAGARYFSNPCRNNSDRGMKVTTLQYEIVSLFTGVKDESRHKEVIQFLPHGAALFGTKRGMKTERRERFESAWNRLQDGTVRDAISTKRGFFGLKLGDYIQFEEVPEYRLEKQDLEIVY